MRAADVSLEAVRAVGLAPAARPPAAEGPTPPARRSRRRSRGRTAVAAGAVLFVGLQAGLNEAIRREWVPVRDPVYAEKLDFLRPHAGFFPDPVPPPASDPPPVRVMALGSSRTQLGFDAGRFAPDVQARAGRPVEAFNFGCPAAGPMTDALYFRRLLQAGARPDVLLVEIHPGFVARSDPPYESRWLHPYRLRPDEVGVLRDWGWDVPPPPQHGWRGWVAASYAYRMGLLNRYYPTLLPCPFGLTVGSRTDPNGYVPGLELSPRERARAVERTHVEYGPVMAEYHVGGPGCAALRDVLTRCREHGVRAGVVLMPESSEFRAWYGAAGYAEVTAFANSLGAEFGAPVIDAREAVPDDGFADGHHQTVRGAQTFTAYLARHPDVQQLVTGVPK